MDPLEIGGFLRGRGLANALGFGAEFAGVEFELVFPILEADAVEVEKNAELGIEFRDFLALHEGLEEAAFDGVEDGVAEGIGVNFGAFIEDFGDLAGDFAGVGEGCVGGVEALEGAGAGGEGESLRAGLGREFDDFVVGMLFAPAEELLAVFR